ncbi:MAG: polyhydroxybutyrate depolymerase [Neomegalonema sp.]|nr:polyhydroxybutyrate depolymerase [Neomegalonema sp.]
MATMRALAVSLFIATISAPSASVACGPTTECRLANGSYHIAAPPTWDGETSLPTVIFFHGHRSSGRAVMRGGVRRAFIRAGWLVIAPNGAALPGRTGRNGAAIRAWPARDAEKGRRDDVAFTEAVLRDAATKYSIDRQRLLVAGFSAGGSMAWRIACLLGGRFAPAYAPISGALRVPTRAAEKGCPGSPAKIIHFHGFTDKQVPLEGRSIRDWAQGDVFATLTLARRMNGCATKPDRSSARGRFWRRDWRSCTSGRVIGFRLHPGGHGTPRGWIAETLRWLDWRA